MTKKRIGFTLIELLVTMTIIVLMIVFAVPAFDKYGAKSSFKLQAAEIQTLINQASIMAKNPEQGVSRYVVKATANNVALYRTDDSTTNNLIKNITVSSDSTITVQGVAADTYLVFDSTSDFSCKTTNATGLCDTAHKLDNLGYILINGGASGSVTFTIFANPFRATY